jgi:hemin uptake protein HemP
MNSAKPGDPQEDTATPAATAASDACPHCAGIAASGESVNSEALLGGRSQLAIRHRQTTYFLRQTRFGKLILTK